MLGAAWIAEPVTFHGKQMSVAQLLGQRLHSLRYASSECEGMVM